MKLHLSSIVTSAFVASVMLVALEAPAPEAAHSVSVSSEAQALALSISPLPLIPTAVDVDSLPVSFDVTVARSYFQ